MATRRRARPRDSGRNAQLVRAMSLINLLDRSGGLSLVELAETLGTNPRTIRRDLQALQEVGFLLTSEQPGKSRLWKLKRGADTRRLYPALDAQHFMALRTAMVAGGPLRAGSSIYTALEDLQDKIEEAIGEEGKRQLAAIERCLFSYEKQAYQRASPNVLWALVPAIDEQRICKVTYRAARPDATNKQFEVLPLRIFVHDGTAHVMCHILKHDTLVSLNLQRVIELQVLDKRGVVPSEFSPERMAQSAFGVHTGTGTTTYLLQFAAQVAPYIRERVWHVSQELRELPGGAVELRFTCGESWEVSAWVASWRHWVHVLEPTTLRRELRALGATLLERYGHGEVANDTASPQRKRKAR